VGDFGRVSGLVGPPFGVKGLHLNLSPATSPTVAAAWLIYCRCRTAAAVGAVLLLSALA